MYSHIFERNQSVVIVLIRFLILSILLTFIACQSDGETLPPTENMPEQPIGEHDQAIIVSVSVTGEENNYTFDVGIRSPDTGCDQYADWWEISDIEDELAYRRILTHSHVDEQPFRRSGGPVRVTKDQILNIRGHMNTIGYGPIIFRGSVIEGFTRDSLIYGGILSTIEPLPDGCDF